MKESELQKQIKDAINDSYLAVCYVASSGLVKSPDGKRFIRMLPEGFPDLFGYRRKDGKFFAIEVKTGTGRLRKNQKEALELLRAHGVLCGVARNIDDALAILGYEQKSML